MRTIVLIFCCTIICSCDESPSDIHIRYDVLNDTSGRCGKLIRISLRNVSDRNLYFAYSGFNFKKENESDSCRHWGQQDENLLAHENDSDICSYLGDTPLIYIKSVPSVDEYRQGHLRIQWLLMTSRMWYGAKSDFNYLDKEFGNFYPDFFFVRKRSTQFLFFKVKCKMKSKSYWLSGYNREQMARSSPWKRGNEVLKKVLKNEVIENYHFYDDEFKIDSLLVDL